LILREKRAYRVGDKVKKRTLLNLSDWPRPLVEGLRALLKGGTVLPPGREAIIIKRSLPHAHVATVATVQAFFGHEPQAATAIRLLRHRYPDFGVKNLRRSEIYKRSEDLDRTVRVLREAGLPE
jgi:hypothetical protein